MAREYADAEPAFLNSERIFAGIRRFAGDRAALIQRLRDSLAEAMAGS